MRSSLWIRPTLLPVALLLAASCASSTKEAAPATPAAPVVATPFAGEVGMGISYLQTRAADLVDATEALLQAVESRNLAESQRAYYAARAPYEEIEVVSRAFPELHRAIDARAHDFVDGELSPEFRGFHRIEIFLFARGKTQPALKYAKFLLDDVEELQAVLADRGRFNASQSFQAMVDRCTEISTKTITGEEETWSDQSLLVIKHGWTGVHSQYRHFATKVRAENVQLGERLDRSYRKALELIAAEFPQGQTHASPYTLISRDKRRGIADASVKLRMYLAEAQQALGLGQPE